MESKDNFDTKYENLVLKLSSIKQTNKQTNNKGQLRHVVTSRILPRPLLLTSKAQTRSCHAKGIYFGTQSKEGNFKSQGRNEAAKKGSPLTITKAQFTHVRFVVSGSGCHVQ